jgi:soluble lytic murein transglycosylase-like protein
MNWLKLTAETCTALALIAAAINPSVAAVYVSEAAGQVPRFASHPVDASFRLLICDESPGDNAFTVNGSATSNSALQRRKATLDPFIQRTAARQLVDPALVRAIIEIESQFRDHAVSRSGAVGAMQLMPDTARRYHVADRRDARQNIEGGVAYLKDLLARFEGNVALALAAYNAGEHAVDRHGRVIPRYRETMLYVPQVLEAYLRYRVLEWTQ